MKRILLTVMLAAAALGLRAQDCEALVLPFFGGDAQRMAEYPAGKFAFRCNYARSAFYVSDTIPAATKDYTVVVRSLSEVKDKATGTSLDDSFVVDLNTLSYYAYTFSELQLGYPRGNVVLCFPTPASEHSYLVLRSMYETHDRAEYPEHYDD